MAGKQVFLELSDGRVYRYADAYFTVQQHGTAELYRTDAQSRNVFLYVAAPGSWRFVGYEDETLKIEQPKPTTKGRTASVKRRRV